MKIDDLITQLNMLKEGGITEVWKYDGEMGRLEDIWPHVGWAYKGRINYGATYVDKSPTLNDERIVLL